MKYYAKTGKLAKMGMRSQEMRMTRFSKEDAEEDF